MTTFHFQTQVSDSGVMALPPLPATFYGENVSVKVDVSDQPKRQMCRNLVGGCGTPLVGGKKDTRLVAVHKRFGTEKTGNEFL